MKRQFLWFVLAGTIGFAVDAGVLYGMLALGAGYFAGRGVSFLAAVWATWQVNRRYTFDVTSVASRWMEWWKYLFAMSGGGVVNYAAYSAVVMLLPKSAWLPIFAVATGSVAGLMVNFLSAKLWVFKTRI